MARQQTDEPVELYRRASEGFDALVRRVGDDQWALPTPCTEWDVRALVRHLVYENLWIPPLLEGQTIEQVGDRFEGDILGDDPKRAWREARQDALKAVGASGVTERVVHLSYGDDSAEEYLYQLFTDHLVHGWDLARGIGADDTLDAELVEACYDYVKRNEEGLRASGLFGEVQPVASGAGRQAELLALLGRRS